MRSYWQDNLTKSDGAVAEAQTVLPTQTGLQAHSARVRNSWLKRMVDIVGAFVLLVGLSPVFAAISLALWWKDGRGIFYSQERGGLHGKPFSIYKFRTMRAPAKTDKPQPDDTLETTHFGAFLRGYSLDELPQLLNVLLGHMSLVGPRPHMRSQDERIGRLVAAYHQRQLVRPGMTGLAQISGFRGPMLCLQDAHDRVKADLSYINDWSLLSDVRILLRTAAKIWNDPNAF